MGAASVARIPVLCQQMGGLYAKLAVEAAQITSPVKKLAYINSKEREKIFVLSPCCLYMIISPVKAWKVTQKWHLFTHLCEWQIPELTLNPRTYWTYADEDWPGLVKTRVSKVVCFFVYL